MSANNQVLLIEKGLMYYVFDNVMAESWSDKNELSITEANFVSSQPSKALARAYELARNTEYGVSDRLVKDGAEVTLIPSP